MNDSVVNTAIGSSAQATKSTKIRLATLLRRNLLFSITILKTFLSNPMPDL